MILRNLRWSEKCERRIIKAWRQFHFLKRNKSSKATTLTKLSGFIGYIVPVLTYAFETWYPTISDIRHIEKVHRKATK